MVDGESVDIGLVGDVTDVNPEAVLDIIDAGRIPVIATVAPDEDGQVHNVNADSAAASLAASLGAEKLVVLTDVPGLYADWPNTNSLVTEINATELAALLPKLETGMVPKMEACLRAVQQGVPRAAVVDGRVAHSLLLEILTDAGFGTMVVPDATPPLRRRHDHRTLHLGDRRTASAPPTPMRTTMMRTFGQPQLVLTRGEGAHVWDEHGRRYLDLLAGLAVNALGHAHPFVNAAITAQLATLGHISNFFASTPQVALAGRLIELVTRGQGSARVFLTNSGTEANEAAVKITRMTGRHKLVATTTGFHGRSIGALSITGKASYREPFEPLLPDVTFVPFGDAEALGAAVTAETAAVVLEPVQGEAGVVVPPPGYLQRGPGHHLGERRAAVAGRGADGDRPVRRVVPAPHRRRPPGPGDGGQGSRQRLPAGRLPRPRRRPATCSGRVRTDPRSAATRSPRSRAWRRCGSSNATGSLPGCGAKGARSRGGSELWPTRWWSRCGRPAC